MSAFTDKQQEVLTQLHQLLVEHFDGYTLAVEAEVEDETKLYKFQSSGGLARELGLLALHEDELWSKFNEQNQPEDHEE